MVPKDEIATKLKEDKKQNPVLAFRKLKKEKEINRLTLLLDDLPSGSWLIRQSREEGMYTITYKEDKIAYHCRMLCDLSEGWVEVSDSEVLKPYLVGGKPYKKFNGQEIPPGLLKILYENFNKDLLVLPPQVFNDPIDALEKVNEILREISFSKDEKSEVKIDREKLIPQFVSWLEVNHLDNDLTDVIDFEFITEPYVLASGIVLDKRSCFRKDTSPVYSVCPVTGKVLEREPQPLWGYQDVLEETLENFYYYLQIEQKTEVEKQNKESYNPSLFRSSTSTDSGKQEDFTIKLSPFF
ncbi:hypothetical protein E3983_06720 [Legionella israelensis]|uniref:SH2 domain-containing protein n=1 Tax=Legionella israelensis TaxID=454 RepID=A0AAX1EG59_9GAMM|nr:SH2 domain-containing protein [Legionella israelensis]QBR84073.1 hypothetical protein E3983_06720 [Legionella israelensis]